MSVCVGAGEKKEREERERSFQILASLFHVKLGYSFDFKMEVSLWEKNGTFRS